MSHTSVLLQETVDGLDIHPGDVFVDGTVGSGGHSAEVLRRFGNTVTIVGIDQDLGSLEVATQKLGVNSDTKKIILVQGNFRNVVEILSKLGVATAQRFLFDIGMSSLQLEESGRGFSFKHDEPLLMTFTKSGENLLTAMEVVNEWEEENLFEIIKGFGEERFARKIARGIVQSRDTKKIETTFELVDIIKKSTPAFYHRGKIHPATRTFQAIRIAVNDELEALKNALKATWGIVSPGGRIAVISFHSLEDRIVKQYFNELKKNDLGLGITKKPIVASREEIDMNPRARSAKLRIIEKKKHE